MAKGSLKKTAQQNATARRNLVLGTGLTQVIHLLLLCFVWSARWSFGQKTLYTLSTALEGFLVVSLLGMSKPTRDSSGQVVSAGEDLSQTGLTSYMFDVVYITWATHILTALISVRFWWLYISIPSYAFYKIYFTLIHHRIFGGSSPAAGGLLGTLLGGGSGSAQAEAPQEEQLSRTQQKKQARGDKQQYKYARR